jgi:hypothetical protein
VLENVEGETSMTAMRKAFAVIVLIAAAFATMGAPHERALADDLGLCFDRPVTIVVPFGTTYHIRHAGETVRGLGNNLIFGSTGSDTICFDAGTDNNVVDGGAGNDRMAVEGGETDDDFFELDAVAFADGGSGNDTLTGSGAGTLRGGAGNDEIDFSDADLVEGGPGIDTVNVADVAKVDCGPGRDRYRFSDVDTAVNCETNLAP